MSEHRKIRPPARADVIAAFDLDTWGDSDDGEPHHAFLCRDLKDDTHAIAYVAACACVGADKACPQTRVLGAVRAFFDSASIEEVPARRIAKRRR